VVDGVLAVIELPMPEVKPALTLPESLLDSVLIREGVLALLPGLETDGVPEPIELPIREVTAESRRPLWLRLDPELTVEEAPGMVRVMGLVARLCA